MYKWIDFLFFWQCFSSLPLLEWFLRQFLINFFGRVLKEFWTPFGCLLDVFLDAFFYDFLNNFGQFLSLPFGTLWLFWGQFFGTISIAFFSTFWELIRHMKSGAQFNRPNKHTEGPATRVNKQNLNSRLRIQGNLFKDLGI